MGTHEQLVSGTCPLEEIMVELEYRTSGQGLVLVRTCSCVVSLRLPGHVEMTNFQFLGGSAFDASSASRIRWR